MKKVLNEVSENYHKGIKSRIQQGLEPGRDATTAEIVARVDGEWSGVEQWVRATALSKALRGKPRY